MIPQGNEPAFQSPLTQGGNFGPPPPPPSNPLEFNNPYATPSFAPGLYPSSINLTGDGLPWETQPKSMQTLWETTKLFYSTPSAAFRKMRKTGDLMTPLLFAMIWTTAGAVVAAIFNGILQALMMALFSRQGGLQGGDATLVVGVIQIAMGIGMALVQGTVGVLIAAFVTGGIYHLLLMMVQGARAPYETSCRVVAYSMGASALLLFIPILGGFPQAVVAIVFSILGLREAHQTTGMKASFAVLMPMVLCCGLIALGLAMAFGLILQSR